MSATTFSNPALAEAPRTSAKSTAQKGFFARLYDAVVAARTEQARREIARFETIYARDRIH